jgi:hypothetical protein
MYANTGELDVGGGSRRAALRERRRCPKCTGNLMLEADVAEGLLLRKCLQCGLIESYFWLERTTRTLVPLPVEVDPPEPIDDW